MTSSKENRKYGKIGGIALRGMIGGFALVGLAACGGQAATSTPLVPTVTKAVQPTATSAAIATATTAPAATSTRAATANTAASPTTAATATGEAKPTMQPGGTATTASDGGWEQYELGATLREWAIDLDKAEIPAGTVTITVDNIGRSQHNLTVLDGSGAPLGATPNFSSNAGPKTLVVDLQPGAYTLICSLPGHAQAGQKTTLTVK